MHTAPTGRHLSPDSLLQKLTVPWLHGSGLDALPTALARSKQASKDRAHLPRGKFRVHIKFLSSIKRQPGSQSGTLKAFNRTSRRLWTAILLPVIAIIVFAFSARTASASTLTITTSTLPNGYVSSVYSSKLAASGGSGTGYSWSLTAGSLPSGLTLVNGVLSGIPKVTGTSSITVKVTDSASNSASQKLSITIDPALKVSTTKLATGYAGTAYTATLAATGGSGKGLAWTISTGTLPKGLALAAATGIISGKPSAAATSSFTVQVKDSAANIATAKLTLTVNPALAISTKTLATGFIAVKYSAALAATGGTETGYKWSITAGTLPAGLTLTAGTGAITGKPVAKGSSKITFEVADSLAHTVTAALTITVNADLSITTSKLAIGYATSKYSAKLAATGGSGAGLSWHLTSGTLPAGLTLSTAGVISGTPEASGSESITVEVKDSDSNVATAKLVITVDPGLSITAGPTLPVGYVGTPYSDTLTVTGGSGAGLKWTTASKISADDFTLTGAGVLSGDPSTAETLAIDVKVTDSAANTASATVALTVNPAITACTNDAQGTAYVELHGVYSFSLNRFNLGTNARSYSVGSFNADGLGNIQNGVMDTNGPAYTAEAQNTFTGSYTVGSDGRGAMTMVFPPATIGQPTETYTFCFALDQFGALTVKGKPNPQAGESIHATVIEDDTTNNVASGEFFQQAPNTAGTYPSPVQMKGTWVVAMAGRRQNTSSSGVPDFRETAAGVITLDGVSKVTSGEVDQDKDGLDSTGTFGNLYTPKVALTGTYALPPAPSGRGTITVKNPAGVGSTFVFYPAGSSYFLLLEIDKPTGTLQPTGVLIGGATKQSSTKAYGLTSLQGSSVRSRYFSLKVNTTDESSGVALDVAQWDGNGNFTYTGDSNSEGVASTTSGSGTYTVDSKGRFAVMVGGVCSPCGYLTGVNTGYAIYDTTEGPLERLEFQDVPIGGPFEMSLLQGGYSLGTRWFIYPEQQTVTGELVSDGSGNITGTLDQNQQGNSVVNQDTVETETSDSNSALHGRFLLNDKTTSTSYALYTVNKNESIAIPLGGDAGKTQPLTVFTHQ